MKKSSVSAVSSLLTMASDNEEQLRQKANSRLSLFLHRDIESVPTSDGCMPRCCAVYSRMNTKESR